MIITTVRQLDCSRIFSRVSRSSGVGCLSRNNSHAISTVEPLNQKSLTKLTGTAVFFFFADGEIESNAFAVGVGKTLVL